MSEVLLFVGAWLVLGVVCTGGYAWAWRCRPRVRHVVLWPLVWAHMFWAVDLPLWAAPAPLQLEARAVKGRYGL